MPTIPTLHLSTPYISNISDIISYFLRHYLYTPSNIYENFLEYEYTIAKRLAQYGTNPDRLTEVVQRDIEEYFNVTFPSSDGYIRYISVTTSDHDETKFNLNIDITIVDQYGNKYGLSPNIYIDNNNIMKINFNDV